MPRASKSKATHGGATVGATAPRRNPSRAPVYKARSKAGENSLLSTLTNQLLPEDARATSNEPRLKDITPEALGLIAIDLKRGVAEEGMHLSPEELARMRRIMAEFETTGRKLRKLYWRKNNILESRFEAACAKLAELGRPTDEVEVFHGTFDANIEPIMRDGFHIGGLDGHDITHGAASGVGIYVCPQAKSCLGYVHKANRLLACRGLPGVSTSDADKLRKIPSGRVGEEKYDSFRGRYGKGGEVLVMRSADQLLPCYMIEFEQEPKEGEIKHLVDVEVGRAKGRSRSKGTS